MDRNRSDGLIHYSLLEVVIHVMGNGLATISGYTQLLQRAISTQAQEAFSPEWEVWQQYNERWLRYVQTMRQSETLLNDFLSQLREFSQEATKERFSQCVMRTDLVLLLKRSIERLAPLHQDRTMQTHLPVQPLYIMCDPLWMEVVLEHVINHTVDAHPLSTPVDIGIRIKRSLLRQNSGTEERFETRSPMLDTRELDVCATLCREILREYGGRIWSEQEAEQEEIVSLALPLVE